MPKFTIDGLSYNSEDLSVDGLATLESLRFVDAQLQHLDRERAVYQTARHSYILALNAALPRE
jgi:hypothetical protein